MPKSSHPKRQRISQACKPCGNRKVKCDGSVPICERCMANNFQCSYSISKRNTRGFFSSSRVPPSPPSPKSPLRVSSHTSLPERLYGPGTSPSAINSGPISVPHHTTAVPVHVSRKLFQTYFRCIHPIWPVLYKPLYNSLDHEQVLEVLPPQLVHAILSIAVLIHESGNEQRSKYDQAQQFFAEALRTVKDPGPFQKGELLMEMKPSIANCQTYAILALQQHGVGEFSKAGTLVAIASSMALDLSLHRRTDADNHVEAQVKSRLWWNIYVLEKMLSCEMGRPALLRAEEAETLFPSVEESDEYEFFSESAQADVISNHKRHHSLKLRTVSAFHSSIRMAMIMESVSRDIYSIAARRRIRQDREAGEETRVRLLTELQEYEIAMDTSPLKLDTTGNLASAPAIVTNYIFIWSTTIVLHRPFMEIWQPSSSEAATSSLQNDPHEICLFAAYKICSTIEMYTRYMCGLPCDLIFPIFVAANILQRHWRRIEGGDIFIRKQLELCVKWLSGLGKSWKGAEPRHQMLSESINSPSQDAQTERPESPMVAALGDSEACKSTDECSNSDFFVMEDNFDQDYLEWVNSLDIQGSA